MSVSNCFELYDGITESSFYFAHQQYLTNCFVIIHHRRCCRRRRHHRHRHHHRRHT